MYNRLVEGVVASIIAAVVLAVLAKAVGLVDFRLDTVVLLLALGVALSLWLSLRVRQKLRSLQEKLATIPYESYFPDESSVYPHLPSLLQNAPRLRLVSLANTNVFYMFEHYRAFLLAKRPIEVLCLDPDASGILDGLDKLVTIAAGQRVIPKLQQIVERLSIPAEAKEEARALVRDAAASSAARTMILLSLCVWLTLAQEAEDAEADASRFLTVRLYRSPPTIKGWIIGDDRVLRGDFSIPGYGLTEPLMLFGGHSAPSEVANFKHTFQLLWTDKGTRTSIGGADLRIDGAIAPASGLFSSLSGSFYEKSGLTAVRKALSCVNAVTNGVAVDLGSGTGHLSFELARILGASGRVIAIEQDGALVAALQKQLNNIGWPTRNAARIEAVAVDAHNVTLPTGSVGLVWCRHSLPHFGNPGGVLSRIWDWLDGAGSLVIIDVAAPEDPELRAYLQKVALLANPKHVRYYSLDELMAMLSPFRFHIEEPTFAQDYETTVLDYARRCQEPGDFKRLEQLVEELKQAPPKVKEYFQIKGSYSSDLVLTLREVVVCCKKMVDVKPDAQPNKRMEPTR